MASLLAPSWLPAKRWFLRAITRGLIEFSIGLSKSLYNLAENQIRPVALGRKNFMFAGSHTGAERAAMMYSFLGSCKLNGVNPQDWLTRVLTVIPGHKANKLEELLPHKFANQ